MSSSSGRAESEDGNWSSEVSSDFMDQFFDEIAEEDFDLFEDTFMEDPNRLTDQGYNLLQSYLLSCEEPNPKLVKTALKLGNNPRHTANTGETVMMCACRTEMPTVETFQTLVERGASVQDARIHTGYLARHEHHTSLFDYFASQGYDFGQVVDQEGNSPLFQAAL
jgi:hypothetical protein